MERSSPISTTSTKLSHVNDIAKQYLYSECKSLFLNWKP